jgi:hypothetical protein
MKKTTLIAGAILTVLLGLETSDAKQLGAKTPQPLAPPHAQAVPDFGRMPLNFIPNAGQVDGPAVFYVQGHDKTIYFAAEGLTFVLSGTRESTPGRWVVKLDFVDANPQAIPVSLEESGAVVSYFKGIPGDWKAGLKASSRIVYRGLWPGIDLAYSGTVDRMKYEFTVHPGADPSRIKLAYRGAKSVTLTDAGRLAVGTPAGGFEDDVPVAWQESGGIRIPVPASYALKAEPAGADGHSRVYGFDVGAYDERFPLVLDPAVLVYCGYLGGAGDEEGVAIALDASGNAYIAGATRSTDITFPVIVGPDLTSQFGVYDFDVYVAKVNAAGTALLYCGYLGGTDFEYAHGIAVDGFGNAYVTGETLSTEATFPVATGPDLTFNGVGFSWDAFVAKVKADGSALDYCGYIGGASEDRGFAIAVDGSGSAYITGTTYSNENIGFPVVVGPDRTGNGAQDIFVAKVNTAGTAFIYCGFIGGDSSDGPHGIALDSSGSAYITGETFSWQATFPVKVGPSLTCYENSTSNGFVAKVAPNGTELVYCGFIGGNEHDYCHAIALDGVGNAYITGETWSTEATFPVRVGPDLSHNDVGGINAFAAKVNAAGTALVYCGYIGGCYARGIAVDDSGFAYVTGTAGPPGSGFPEAANPNLTYNGEGDAFVAKLNPHGTGFVYAGYVGGENMDAGCAIAVDGSGSAYITGFTRSGALPPVVGPDPTFNGGDYDAFVAKISPYDVSDPNTLTLVPEDARAGDPAFVLQVTGDSFAEGAVVRWDGSDRSTVYVSEQELRAEIGAADLATVKPVLITVWNPDGGVSNALEFSVGNPVPDLASLSQTRATGGGSSLSLTLIGSNFVTGSVVNWAGNAKTTTYVSATELRASIPATDLAAAGDFPVTVSNPSPGGGTSSAISFQVAGFVIEASPASITVSAGQSATCLVQVTPEYGSFDSSASFRCTGLPRACTASFSPTSLTPGAAPASTTLTLKTSVGAEAAAGGVLTAPPSMPIAPSFLILVSALGLWLCFMRPVPLRRYRRSFAAAVLMVCLIAMIASCSAGSGENDPYRTPPGTYQVDILGQAGNFQATASITLVVR